MSQYKKKRTYYIRICKYSGLPFLSRCKGNVCLKHDKTNNCNGLTICMDYKSLNEEKKKFSYYCNTVSKEKPYKYTKEHIFKSFNRYRKQLPVSDE
jgi:hypothetical protein